MARALEHRGPDDEGYYQQGAMVLAQTRLSIIDLETGHQPILNEDETLVLVCNGEIYNSPELRTHLIEKATTSGHEPMSRLFCTCMRSLETTV
ncbi:MAG: hypothetical protein L7U43_08165 [Arenicellales bacterium]|nr:hypothetical protein [Arenicellales bacterium]